MADPRPISISTHPHLEPDAIAGREFPVVWRGYNPEAVHRFLVDVSQLVRVARSRQQELSDRLAEAERRAAEPEIDEATISAALGSETAKVLHAAHAAANEVLAKAEAHASRVVAEAETASEELRHRAEAEALAIVSDARAAANTTIEEVKEDCRAMIDESREVRRRVLSDLAERRKVYYSQIEQLRAGKDTLATVVAHVADTIAAVQARLDGSEDDARAAAEVARRATELEPDAELVGSDEAGAPAYPVAEIDSDASEAGGAVAERAEPATADPFGASAAGEAAGEEAEGGTAGKTASVVDTSGAAIVDELFARIRESSAGGGSPPVPAGPPPEAADLVPAIDLGAGEEPPASDTQPAPAGGDTDPVPESLRLGDTTVDRHQLLRRRDERVKAPLAELVHVLKRAMRVEQNELMVRLREASPGRDTSALFSLTDEARHLAEAAGPALASVWREGEAFAREAMGPVDGTPGAGAPDDAACRAAAESLAAGLGKEIADSIESRLGESLRDGDAESLRLAVSAAYRDWKTERIEETAGDYVTNAFALGTLEAVRSSGTLVSWVVDDGTSRCSDCDDNELAGLLGPGEAFPTGQAHPPAHGGCRCLLAPAGGRNRS
ncbi:MAG: DivIVA domain-containing protein [Acidimicrobiales bacterium]